MLRLAARLVILGLALATASVGGGCGGKGARSEVDAKATLDADPFALLPASAIAIANIDARAIVDSTTVGTTLAASAQSLVPLGDDADLHVSRDVDRIVVASYGTGTDVAAVLTGHFDAAALAAATKARSGATIVHGTYAGFATSSVGQGMFVALTSKTVVAGTGDGVRRVLDRIAQSHDGKLDRAMPSWMSDTLETKGAQLAVAADFASQPTAAAALHAANIPWLAAVRVARVVGNFQSPGMNLAATLTYADATQAQTAADGVHVVDGWLKLLGGLLGGAKLQNLVVSTEGADLHCAFAVDDQTLRTLVALAQRYLPSVAE